MGELDNEGGRHELVCIFGGGDLSLELHLLAHVELVERAADALGEEQRVVDQADLQRLAVIFERQVEANAGVLEAVPDFDEFVLEEHAATADDALPLLLAEGPNVGEL